MLKLPQRDNMKFKELREANLSKAQINKVHDKADDLPKSDFIKRYGKEGDAVRFATATNIVKKQLGIESLDKEDEKSVGRVIKQLKKAVKAHQGQVDTLAKDIKDEVELDEARARMPSDNNIKKKHGNATPMKSYKQGFDAANKGKKITTNPHKSMFGFDRGAWDKGFKDADQGFDIKTFSQRDYDRNGKIKKEEVEITEAISDAQVDQIARMTDRNDHFGVRIEIARLMKDKQLMSFYDSLEKMHMTSQIQNAIGNDAVSLRGKLEKVLKVRMKQRFGDKDSKRIMDAL